MLNTQAIEQENIDAYSTFSDVSAQIPLLAKRQNIFSETVDEINTLIIGWKKENIRKKSLKLLTENGFDIANSKNIIVIEWGGGGLSYRALYLSENVFFIGELDDKNLSIKKIDIDKNMLKETIAIQSMIEKEDYEGNISSAGDDFQTYIVTILSNTDKEKPIVIYGASVANIKDKKSKTNNEKDTITIFDLIMKIKKNCYIKPESGA